MRRCEAMRGTGRPTQRSGHGAGRPWEPSGRSGARRRWLWRWRSNPLRRREDVVEAWIVLGVWTAIGLGGPLVGTVSAHSAEDAFARQRTERHSVQAVLMKSTSSAVRGGWDGARVRATVRWTANGITRTDQT